MLGGLGWDLRDLQEDLQHLPNPAVVLGATLGTHIAAIGAGFVRATYLMGGALGKFADGLKAIGDVDGTNLLEVAKGTLALQEQWWQWQVEVVCSGGYRLSLVNFLAVEQITLPKIS